MHSGAPEAVWAESPLQLVAAAEWAAARDVRPDVAFRLTGPAMSATAAELLERGAPFSSCVPYLGIPWALLGSAREWAVGDALSGQFQFAAALLRPRRVTLLDDGAASLRTAGALLGRSPLLRPGRAAGRGRALLAEVARERMTRLAARGRLAVHSVYADDEPVRALRGLGADVGASSFAWTRRTATATAPAEHRILLGTALVADGALTAADHRTWVLERLRAGPALYLPHRREPEAVLDVLHRLPGLTVSASLLPVELLLAGAPQALRIHALPTSARRTLEAVLAGTGSTISETALAAVGERSPSR